MNIRDHSGALQAVISDWDESGGGLTYSRELLNIGKHSIMLPMDHPALQYITKDSFFEVMRNDPAHHLNTFYQDYVGFNRNVGLDIDARGKQLVKISGVDMNHLLKRKSIDYFTNDPLAGQNTFADDAMKNFVEQNAGPSATSPPRVYDGVTFALTVAPSTGSSPLIWSGQRGWQNLLDTVREISLAALVDFNTFVASWKPLSIVFQTYYPFLGTNRAVGQPAPAVFSPQAGNMGAPKLTYNSENEETVAIVLGSGSGSDRVYTIVVDDGSQGYSNGHVYDSPWNSIEKVTTQTSDGLVAQLNDVGLYELQHNDTQLDFIFDVLENNNLAYGRDWFFGDQITASYNLSGIPALAQPISRRVTAVSISVAGADETIRPTFSQPG